MMVLGLEEPLHWNKQMYALDESARERKLSKIEDDGLNRYSFIWSGDIEKRDQGIKELLKLLTLQNGEDPCWYLVWDASEENHDPAILQAKLDKRSEQGWEVHQGKTLAIGQKMFDMDQLDHFAPMNHINVRGDGGLFLIWGNVPAGPDLVLPPTKNSLEDFCANKDLAPSSPFLSWVRERRYIFAYALRDLQSRLAIVVLTPSKIDVEEMKSRGMISTVHEGRDAQLAWCT